MSLLVIGTIALDTVHTPFGKNTNALGGSGIYASVSASYFTDVKIIGVIGNDFPRKHLKTLEGKGIDLSGIETKKAKTFRWEGRYTWDLNSAQTLATHLNVLSDFKPLLSNRDKKYDFIFLANNDPQIQLDIISQAGPGKIIAADTIEFWIKTKRPKLLKVLKGIDMFIINENEARLLTKEANLVRAAQRIISLGAKRVIIKKGEHGALYFTNKSSFVCPAYPLENVYDPTGAGDSFAGGFLGFLSSVVDKNSGATFLSEACYRKAIIYATIMASYDVEGFDLKVLLRLNKQLIKKRYREFEKLVRF
jgi:sugar/nucleoside kinase (ribokinase family)